MDRAQLAFGHIDAGIRQAHGLDEVIHLGPTWFDARLLVAPSLPPIFLRGVGVSRAIIDLLGTIDETESGVGSCIVYDNWYKARPLSDRLCQDLSDLNVNSWHGYWRGTLDGRVVVRNHSVIIILDKSIGQLTTCDYCEFVDELLSRPLEHLGVILVSEDEWLFNADHNWARQIRERYPVINLTHWQRPDEYTSVLQEILSLLAGHYKSGGTRNVRRMRRSRAT